MYKNLQWKLLTITAVFANAGSFSSAFNSVVLPLPRNPDSRNTGTIVELVQPATIRSRLVREKISNPPGRTTTVSSRCMPPSCGSR